MCLATMSRARSSSVASRTKTGTVKVSRAECLGAIRDSFYSGLFECELDDGRVPLWTIVDPQIGTVWLSRHGPSLAPFSTNRTAGAAGTSRPSFAVFFGPPFADIHQKLQLPVVLGLGDWLRLERQRFFGSRIIEVPGHKVDVKMRHHVAEQLVVHVTRRKHALDHLRGGVNVAPVPGGFCRSQTRKVCDVAVAEDDDHMAASDGVSLKVCVANTSHIKRRTEIQVGCYRTSTPPRLVSGRPNPRAMFASLAFPLPSVNNRPRRDAGPSTASFPSWQACGPSACPSVAVAYSEEHAVAVGYGCAAVELDCAICFGFWMIATAPTTFQQRLPLHVKLKAGWRSGGCPSAVHDRNSQPSHLIVVSPVDASIERRKMPLPCSPEVAASHPTPKNSIATQKVGHSGVSSEPPACAVSLIVVGVLADRRA